MKKTNLTLLGLGFVLYLCGQSYTTYFTGSTTDVQTSPAGGICMMGGSTENDNAMRWFLQGAAGGDILVLRASGSNGYNDYMYAELSVAVNSVETIRFNSPEAANDPYIRERIAKAEAIWIAGGDQWNYVAYWRNTPIENAINDAIAQRNIMIGGTSAGMAILGGAYFSAQNGTVTSNEALSNPYANNMTVDNTPFLNIPFLNNVITDTHYDQRNRKGRHVAFLAKALTDYGQTYYGIACNERTAVCINAQGIARVYGTYPDYEDTAYFLAPNCAITDNFPELCAAAQPLTWDQNNEALKVYAVKGTPTGIYQFDLNNWQEGQGGDWENWFVDNGQLAVVPSLPPDCMPVVTETYRANDDIKLYPNPTRSNWFNLELPANDRFSVRLYDLSGKYLNQWNNLNGHVALFWNFPVNGIYSVEIQNQMNVKKVYQLVVKY